VAKYKYREGQLGLFKPESDWKPLTELPDLRNRNAIAVDSETRDLGIESGRGAGWCFGDSGGYVCGVSFATDDASGYIPIRHPDTPDCFDKEQVARWLEDHYRSGVPIVMFNSPYDVGWSWTGLGVEPPERLEDAQCAAVMINENLRAFSLDAIAKEYNVKGKDTAMLKDAVEAYGGNRNEPQKYIYKLPARYAAPYAIQDAQSTLEIWRQQEPILKTQEVWDAYCMEMELVPMTVAMRKRGIPVDTDQLIEAGKMFQARSESALRQISEGLGRAVSIDDVNSPAALERIFQVVAKGIVIPKSEKGYLSFSSTWMEGHEHWLPKAVVEAQRYHEANSKFIQTYLLGHAHRGRIHAEVNQFLREEGGTRSHRFSYSSPPLQQMPGVEKPTTKDMGIAIRNAFLPEPGADWLSADYSQQEPRLTVHFAALCKCRGADVAVQRYANDARTDYHSMVAEMTKKPRSVAKILNLGMTYGKGKRSIAEELRLPLAEAEELLKDYHARLPFIKALEDTAKKAAARRGYIRLIDGSRMRYDSWEGQWIDSDVRRAAIAAGKNLAPCSIEEARERQKDTGHPWHGQRLRRAETRKALNNLVQGSAARQTKKAMLLMWREGILPCIQMHDEIGASVTTKREVERIGEIMRDAVPLLVPVVVDLEVGPCWGRAKSSWDDWQKLKAAA
jgi:DNA polymerase-1